MRDTITSALDVVQVLSAILVFLIGIGLLVVIVMYIVDVNQTEHAIRRNFPVIGRFRYLFENLGEYFRQYFFANDREEMPFNRAQRSWVYRAAKDIDNTVAFGSTRDLRPVGTYIFVNCPVNPATYFVMLLALFFVGSGRLSLDHLLGKRLGTN